MCPGACCCVCVSNIDTPRTTPAPPDHSPRPIRKNAGKSRHASQPSPPCHAPPSHFFLDTVPLGQRRATDEGATGLLSIPHASPYASMRHTCAYRATDGNGSRCDWPPGAVWTLCRSCTVFISPESCKLTPRAPAIFADIVRCCFSCGVS
jgi:hypothetical protein